MEELEWCPEVTADEIGVGVHEGTVTLSGQVSAYPEKVAAVAATLRVRGVTGVADEIEVQHDRGHLADSEIAGAAARILTSNVILPQGRVASPRPFGTIESRSKGRSSGSTSAITRSGWSLVCTG
jgi:hypothetical protein